MAIGDDNNLLGKADSIRVPFKQKPFDYAVPWNELNLSPSLWKPELKLPVSQEKNIQIPLRPANVAFDITANTQISGNGDAVIESLEQNYGRNFDVTKNFFAGTAADLNKYLANTKMAGMGEAFLEAQEKYGVNALFLMAIVNTESGYGNAPARDKNGIKPYNVAGLKKARGGYQNNASYEACIDSLGSSLKRLYFKNGKVTVENIRKTFCPGNPKWTDKVSKEMKKISSDIIQQYTR